MRSLKATNIANKNLLLSHKINVFNAHSAFEIHLVLSPKK